MTRPHAFLLFALAIGLYKLVHRRRQGTPRMPDRAINECCELHRENLDSYQALLDESLQLTFPASDPVSVDAATRCAHPHPTAVDPHDWRRRPGLIDAAAATQRR